MDNLKNIIYFMERTEKEHLFSALEALKPSSSTLQHLVTRSIQNNATEIVSQWMDKRYPGFYEKTLNGLVDKQLYELLRSPKTWIVLEKLNLQPKLNITQIYEVSSLWNASAFGRSNFIKRSNFDSTNRIASLLEDMSVHLRFLDFYHISFLEKYALLNRGISAQLDILTKYRSNFYSPHPEDDLFFKTRAASFNTSGQSDMWILVMLAKKSYTTLMHMTMQTKHSAWWEPLLKPILTADARNASIWNHCLKNMSLQTTPATNVTLSHDMTSGNYDTSRFLDMLILSDYTIVKSAPIGTDFEFEAAS